MGKLGLLAFFVVVPSTALVTGYLKQAAISYSCLSERSIFDSMYISECKVLLNVGEIFQSLLSQKLLLVCMQNDNLGVLICMCIHKILRQQHFC